MPPSQLERPQAALSDLRGWSLRGVLCWITLLAGGACAHRAPSSGSQPGLGLDGEAAAGASFGSSGQRRAFSDAAEKDRVTHLPGYGKLTDASLFSG